MTKAKGFTANFGNSTEDDDMTRDDLLLYLCKETARVPAGGFEPKIYSIRSIAEHFGESQYKTRKFVKELEANGMIRRDYIGGLDEDGYPHCYHGWSITEKVYSGEMYTKCYKEAIADYEKWQQEFK